MSEGKSNPLPPDPFCSDARRALFLPVSRLRRLVESRACFSVNAETDRRGVLIPGSLDRTPARLRQLCPVHHRGKAPAQHGTYVSTGSSIGYLDAHMYKPSPWDSHWQVFLMVLAIPGRTDCDLQNPVREQRNRPKMAEEAPGFRQPIKSIAVIKGKPAKFEAIVTGTPEPEVSWYVNGKEVASTDNTKISREEGGRVSLVLTSVTDDAGNIACTARNSGGTASSTAKLVVREPPDFVQRLKSQRVKEGSRVEMVVRFKGTPMPKIRWYRERAELQSTEDFRIVTEGDTSRLVIEEVYEDDSGKFSATATNVVGRVISAAHLMVTGMIIRVYDPTCDSNRTSEYSRQADARSLPGTRAFPRRSRGRSRDSHDRSTRAQGRGGRQASRGQTCRRTSSCRSESRRKKTCRSKAGEIPAAKKVASKEDEQNLFQWKWTKRPGKPRGKPGYLGLLETAKRKSGQPRRVQIKKLKTCPQIPEYTLPKLAFPSPLGVKASDVADTSVTLKWTPVTGATDYRVAVTPPDGQVVDPVGGPSVWERTVAGLRPGQEYVFTVTAIGQEGQSNPSKPVKISTAGATGKAKVISPQTGKKKQASVEGGKLSREGSAEDTVTSPSQLRRQGDLVRSPSQLRRQGTDDSASVSSFHTATGEEVMSISSYATAEAGTQEGASEVSTIEEMSEGEEDELSGAPEFNRGLGSCQVARGESVRFECEISGSPPPTIIWLKDGKEIDEDNQHFAKYGDDGSFALVITNVTDADSGAYSCQATNKKGQATSTAELTVKPQKNSVHTHKPASQPVSLATIQEEVKVQDLKPPTEISATYVSDAAITVSWKPVAGATDYNVIVSPADGVRRVEGLKSGTEYTFTVVATRKNGHAVAGVPLTQTTREVPTPGALRSESVTDTGLTLAWLPTPGATDYEVSISPPGGDVHPPSGATTEPQRVISGLEPGKEYEVTVTAKIGNKRSAQGESFKVTTKPLGTPAGFSANKITDNSMFVSWTPVSGATDYEVKLDPPAGEVKPTEKGSTVAERQLTGLSGGIEYRISVGAKNQKGDLVWAEPFSVETKDLPTPSGTGVSGLTDNEMTVTWAPVPGATDYVLKVQPQVGEVQVPPEGPGEARRHLTGLLPGVDYTIVVEAKGDKRKRSAPCAPMKVKTKAALCSPSDIKTSSVTASSATLEWEMVPGATDYKVHMEPSDGQVTKPKKGGHLPQREVKNLTPGKEYVFTITAVSPAGNSAPSEEVRIGTPEIAGPSDLKVPTVTDTEATLSWAPVPGAKDYKLRTQPKHGDVATPTGDATSAQRTISGLHPGTNYSVYVSAVTDQGVGAESQPAHIKTKALPCPCSLNASEATDSEFKVAWLPVEGAENYVVTIDPPGGQVSEVTGNPSTPARVISGLEAGREYRVSVTATGKKGDSAPCEPFNVKTKAGISATAITASSFEVTWTPVRGASEYEVRMNPDSGKVEVPEDGPSAPRRSITGLSAGIEYQITIVAKKESGAAQPSEPFMVKTRTLQSPKDLNAPWVTDSDLTLTWAKVRGATDYAVRLQPPAGEVTETENGPTAPERRVTGLLPGTEYKISVEAVGSEGRSSPSHIKIATKPLRAPFDLAATSITDRTMLVSWPAVPGATDYRVTMDPPDGEVTVARNAIAESKREIKGLQAGKEYQITVLALSPVGSSAPSESFVVKTRALAAPSGISPATVTDNSAGLKWTAVPGATDYTLTVEPAGGEVWETQAGPGDPERVITGLQSGTEYEITVSATGPDGTSAPSERIKIKTEALAAPSEIKQATVANEEIVLKWNPVPGATDYELTVEPPAGDIVAMKGDRARPMRRLTGLTPGTEYKIVVVAKDAKGNARKSDTISATTLNIPKAEGLRAYDITDTTVYLRWAAISGSKDYTINLRPSAIASVSAPENDMRTPERLVQGLQPSTEYNISVSAITADGRGPPCNPVTIVTKALPMPEDFKLVTVTDEAALISWAPIEGAKDFHVAVEPAGPEVAPTEAGEPASERVLRGLQPARDYWVTVTAKNEKGESNESQTFSFKTMALSTPSGFKASRVTDTTCVLSWTPVSGSEDYTVKVQPQGGEVAVPPAGPSASERHLKRLKGKTTYTVTIVATSSKGTSAESQSFTFTTTELPSPSGVEVSSVTASGLVLAWSPVSGATDYIVTSEPDARVSPGEAARTMPSGWCLVSNLELILDTPAKIEAATATTNTAVITWTAVKGATDYKLVVEPPGAEVLVDKEGPAAPKRILKGLHPDTHYHVYVTAISAAGESTRSEALEIQTAALPSPARLSAPTVTDRSVLVSWAPTEGAEEYIVKVEPECEVVPTAGGPGAPERELRNLKPATEYTIRVAARGPLGTSADSEPLPIRTNALPTPSKVEVPFVSDKEVRVSWPAVPGATDYHVKTQPEASVQPGEGGPGAPERVVTGLKPNTEYSIRVVALTKEGSSAMTEPVKVTTKALETPSKIQPASTTADTAVITWSAVKGATDYKVVVEPSGPEVVVDKEGPAAPKRILKGLHPDTEYIAYVTAVSDAGDSTQSEPFKLRTPGLPVPARLGTPTVTDRNVIVSWAPIEGAEEYIVKVEPECEVVPTAGGPGAPERELRNLKPATEYIVRVAAKFPQGVSAESEHLAIRTNALPAPTGVEVPFVSDKEVRVSWPAVPGATDYHVKTQPEASVQPGEGGPGAPERIVTGLNPKTEYSIKVVALTQKGSSALSEPVKVTTKALPRPNESKVKSVTDNSAIITWTGIQGAADYQISVEPKCEVRQTKKATAPERELRGLLSGTEYTVTITAVGKSGTSAVSEPLIVRTKALSKPSRVTAGKVGDTSALLVWAPAEAATNYVLTVNPPAEAVPTDKGPSGPERVLKGLKTNTEYTVSVTAKNPDGTSAPSDEFVFKTKALPSPEQPSQAAVTDTTATVTWAAVPGATDYAVKVDPAEGQVMETADGAGAPVRQIQGLKPGTEYKVVVSGKGEKGDGAECEPIVIKTNPLPSPAAVKPTSVEDNKLTLGWSAVPGATDYKIVSSPEDVQVVTRKGGRADSERVITGLRPGTEYSFSVVAVCPDGNSAQTEPVKVTTKALPTPGGVKAGTVEDTTATVVWSNVPGASDYTVQVEPTGEVVLTKEGPAAPVREIRGLQAGQEYRVAVVGKGPSGESAPCEPISIKTNVLATPSGIKPSTIDDNSVTLAWTSVPGATDYVISGVPDGAKVSAGKDGPAGAERVVTGLQAATDYSISVTAVSSKGESGAGQPVRITTKALPTPDDVAVSSSADSATITWAPVPGAKDYDIVTDPPAEVSPTDKGPSAAERVVKGLKPGTDYEVKIAATNDKGVSNPCRPIKFSTKACQRPTGVKSPSITDNQATITWSPVPGATDYRVLVEPAEGSVKLPAGGPGEAERTIVGLTAGAEYTVSVIGMTEKGSGEASEPVKITTRALPAPLGVKASAVKTTSVTLSWSPVTGAQDYRVEVVPKAGRVMQPIGGPATWERKIVGLEPLQDYEFTVVAVQDKEESLPSKTLKVTTVPADKVEPKVQKKEEVKVAKEEAKPVTAEEKVVPPTAPAQLKPSEPATVPAEAAAPTEKEVKEVPPTPEAITPTAEPTAPVLPEKVPVVPTVEKKPEEKVPPPAPKAEVKPTVEQKVEEKLPPTFPKAEVKASEEKERDEQAKPTLPVSVPTDRPVAVAPTDAKEAERTAEQGEPKQVIPSKVESLEADKETAVLKTPTETETTQVVQQITEEKVLHPSKLKEDVQEKPKEVVIQKKTRETTETKTLPVDETPTKPPTGKSATAEVAVPKTPLEATKAAVPVEEPAVEKPSKDQPKMEHTQEKKTEAVIEKKLPEAVGEIPPTEKGVEEKAKEADSKVPTEAGDAVAIREVTVSEPSKLTTEKDVPVKKTVPVKEDAVPITSAEKGRDAAAPKIPREEVNITPEKPVEVVSKDVEKKEPSRLKQEALPGAEKKPTEAPVHKKPEDAAPSKKPTGKERRETVPMEKPPQVVATTKEEEVRGPEKPPYEAFSIERGEDLVTKPPTEVPKTEPSTKPKVLQAKLKEESQPKPGLQEKVTELQRQKLGVPVEKPTVEEKLEERPTTLEAVEELMGAVAVPGPGAVPKGKKEQPREAIPEGEAAKPEAVVAKQKEAAKALSTPGGIKPSSLTETGATIAWKPVPGATNYSVSVSPAHGRVLESSGGASGAERRLTDLQPNTEYTVSIAAEGVKGTSATSAPVVIKTKDDEERKRREAEDLRQKQQKEEERKQQELLQRQKEEEQALLEKQRKGEEQRKQQELLDKQRREKEEKELLEKQRREEEQRKQQELEKQRQEEDKKRNELAEKERIAEEQRKQQELLDKQRLEEERKQKELLDKKRKEDEEARKKKELLEKQQREEEERKQKELLEKQRKLEEEKKQKEKVPAWKQRQLEEEEKKKKEAEEKAKAPPAEKKVPAWKQRQLEEEERKKKEAEEKAEAPPAEKKVPTWRQRQQEEAEKKKKEAEEKTKVPLAKKVPPEEKKPVAPPTEKKAPPVEKKVLLVEKEEKKVEEEPKAVAEVVEPPLEEEVEQEEEPEEFSTGISAFAEARQAAMEQQSVEVRQAAPVVTIDASAYAAMAIAHYPTSVRTSQVQDRTLMLNWDPVVGAEDYDVSFDPCGDAEVFLTDYGPVAPMRKIRGLKPCKTYKITVSAKKANKERTKESEVIKVTTKALPSPSEFRAIRCLDNKVLFGFDAVYGATSYIVGTDSKEGVSRVTRMDYDRVEVEISDLLPATEYQVTVTAQGPKGVSAPSKYFTIGTKVITEPEDLVAKADSENDMTVTWSHVKGATDYEFLISPEGKVKESGATARKVSGLKPGVEYRISVAAKKGELVGSSAVTRSFTKALARPESMRCVSASDTSVIVAWNRVQGATGYDVETRPAGGTAITPKLPGAPEREITGLRPATEYQIIITGRSSRGDGLASQPLKVKTKAFGAVSSIRVTNCTDTTATIRWSPVNGATSYDVKLDPSEGRIRQTNGSQSPERQITGLVPNKEYSVIIVPKSASGEGSVNKPFTFTTMALSTPSNIKVTDITEEGLSLTWDEVPGAYDYSVWMDPPGATIIPGSGGARAPERHISRLKSNKEYSITIVAESPRGDSCRSDPVEVTTEALHGPTGLKTTNITQTGMRLSFNPVANARDYEVVLRPRLGTVFAPGRGNDPSQPERIIEDLKPNTEYDISVIAITNKGVKSEVSKSIKRRTYAFPPPSGVTATSTTGTTVALQWSAVTGADNYTVDMTPRGGEAHRTDKGASAPERLVKGLQPGTVYEFSVTAKGKGGQSPPGETFKHRTKDLVSPKGFEASSVTDNSIVLSWTPVKGASKYNVTTTSFEKTTESSAGEATTEIKGLKESTEYTFVVTAEGHLGKSAPSAPFAHTTRALKTPVGLKASSVTHSSMTITWAPIAGATDYAIEVKPEGANVAVTTKGKQAPERQLTNLKEGTEYRVVVLAVSSHGMSAASEPLIQQTSLALSAPTGLRVTSVKETSLTVVWGSVKGATSYDVSVDPAHGKVVAGPRGLTQPERELQGLNPGTDYTIRVVSKGLRGQKSADSAPITQKTKVLSVPQRIKVKADPTAQSEMEIQWTPVEGAANYKITLEPPTGVDSTAATSDITKQKEFRVKITAVDEAGQQVGRETFVKKTYAEEKKPQVVQKKVVKKVEKKEEVVEKKGIKKVVQKKVVKTEEKVEEKKVEKKVVKKVELKKPEPKKPEPQKKVEAKKVEPKKPEPKAEPPQKKPVAPKKPEVKKVEEKKEETMVTETAQAKAEGKPAAAPKKPAGPAKPAEEAAAGPKKFTLKKKKAAPPPKEEAAPFGFQLKKTKKQEKEVKEGGLEGVKLKKLDVPEGSGSEHEPSPRGSPRRGMSPVPDQQRGAAQGKGPAGITLITGPPTRTPPLPAMHIGARLDKSLCYVTPPPKEQVRRQPWDSRRKKPLDLNQVLYEERPSAKSPNPLPDAWGVSLKKAKKVDRGTDEFKLEGVRLRHVKFDPLPDEPDVVPEPPPGFKEGAPKFQLPDNMKETIELLGGQPCNFTIPIDGTFKPEITIMKDNKPIELDERVKIYTVGNLCKVKIAGAERLDRGKYKIDVKTPKGTDTTNFTVNVKDTPSQPKGPVIFKSVMSDNMEVSWQLPDDDGGAPLQGFELEICESGKKDWKKIANIKDRKHKVTGLKPDTRYQYRVTAINEHGKSTVLKSGKVMTKHPEAEAAWDVQLKKVKKDPPDPPQNVRVTKTAKKPITQAQLVWDKPISDHGSRIKGYVVERKKEGSSDWMRLAEAKDCKKEEFLATGFSEGFEYWIRIRAVNAGGESEPAPLMDPEILKIGEKTPPPPPKPVMPPGPVQNLQAEAKGDGHVTINWKPPKDRSNVTGYVIQKLGENDEDWVEIGHVGTRRSSSTCTGWIPAKTTTSVSSRRAWRELANLPSPRLSQPSASTDVSATVEETEKGHETNVRLNWTPPTDGSIITGFRIEKKPKRSTEWSQIVTVGPDETTYLVEDMTPDEEFDFRIVAESPAGDGKPGGTSVLMPPAKPPEVPPELGFSEEDIEALKQDLPGPLRIVKGLTDLEVPIRTTALYYCVLSKINIMVRWMCGYTDILPGKKYQTKIVGRLHILWVSDCRYDDEGIYKVEIPTKEASTAKLKIMENWAKPGRRHNLKPFFETPLVNYWTDTGMEAQMTVKYGGYPTPKIRWNRGLEMIRSGPKYEFISADDEVQTLIIKNVAESDAGEYTVTITNEAGEKTSTGSLIVGGAGAPAGFENQFPLGRPIRTHFTRQELMDLAAGGGEGGPRADDISKALERLETEYNVMRVDTREGEEAERFGYKIIGQLNVNLLDIIYKEPDIRL
ncbi:hypothetical protein Bbelb_348400 [Branchiostoma belcheri]|nr:hypothetical protein Bbelb_348400 [Branchiostoma belcheri]